MNRCRNAVCFGADVSGLFLLFVCFCFFVFLRFGL